HHQGHRLPVGVAIRLPRRRRGLLLAPRPQERCGARTALRDRPQHRRSLPAQRRSPAGRAGRHQGAPADHRHGRYPFLVGAGLRRQERRDPALRERSLVQSGHGQAGAVPRPVRGAVRPRSRLHAHRGRRTHQGGLRALAQGQGRRAETGGRPRRHAGGDARRRACRCRKCRRRYRFLISQNPLQRIPMAEPLSPAASHDEHDHKPHGWRRWVYATNHKDIGTMYLIFACTMFFIGGFMAMLIRLELFKPGLQFFDPQFFNSMTTMHALIMIFGAVMPAWTGLANWMVPMQVGAPDMALPRLNNFSFWILPFAFTLLLSSLFVPGGAPAGGWTMYPPLVLQTGASFPMLVFSIHLMGASSIL